MNKKILKLIIVLISIASVMLILFQSVWINESLGIKKQQFDHGVNKSLISINRVIEELEVVNHSLNYLDADNNKQRLITGNYNTLTQSKNSITSKLHEQRFFKLRDIDSLQIPRLRNIYSSDTSFNYRNNFSLKNKSKYSDVQSYANISNRTVMVELIENKLIQIEMNIEDRISKQLLDSVITSELIKNGIYTKYIYRVVDNLDKTIFASDTNRSKFSKRLYSTRLFPDDVVSKPSFLEIVFPSRSGFIINSIWPMLLSSIILTFIIIATFYYTLSVIVRQKKISEMKNDFVNNMTHELKTPIATISLAAQMMCDNNIPTDSKNFESMGDIISKESKRLGLQVEKVLQMATLENGEIKLKKKEINVHSTIENIVRSNRMLVEQSGGVIKTCLKADYCTIKADEIHFVNIITNLLENAIKYSKGNLVITLSTKNNDRGVYISISDNGIGIKKDDQKHIFDQFFRVHTGNRHDVKGFGLGLSYVKKIIDLHDANISVDSKIGEGTTFVIFFPFINKQ